MRSRISRIAVYVAVLALSAWIGSQTARAQGGSSTGGESDWALEGCSGLANTCGTLKACIQENCDEEFSCFGCIGEYVRTCVPSSIGCGLSFCSCD
jgi:hypothetical protein